MKKFWMIVCIFLCLSSISAQDSNGYYIGEGGKGQRVLVYKSFFKGSGKDGELISSMIKKDIISYLKQYSEIDIIDSSQQEIVRKLQEESEKLEYDESKAIELGKLEQAKKYLTITTTEISGKYKVSFDLVDIETGTTEGSYNSSQLYEEKETYILKAPREATAELLSQLGVELSPSGRRNLLQEFSTDTNKNLSDAQEDLVAIKNQIEKLTEERKKTLATQQADQQEQMELARLKNREQVLLSQQRQMENKIARLKADAERQRQEEELAAERSEKQREAIRRWGLDVEQKISAIHKQQSKNMTAVQKIAIIESEKQLLADNWIVIESGSAESSQKLEDECAEEQEKRRNRPLRKAETAADGSISEMAQKLMDTDLELIRKRYDKLQNQNSENEQKFKEAQKPLENRIASDISNLVKTKYTADTLAEEGLFLRLGDYDANKCQWQYTLSYTMNEQVIFSSEGFFAYEEITGKKIPEIPTAKDKKYKEKAERYNEYLDEVEGIDSFFRLNVPYLQAKIDYTVLDLSALSPSVYGVSVSQVQFINIQRGKVFRKEKLEKENIFVSAPAVTLKPVDAVVKNRLSNSEITQLLKWKENETAGEFLRKNALLAGISGEKSAVGKYEVEKSLVKVSGGNFTMGNSTEGISEHRVYVDGFKMSATEVTQNLYQVVMGKNPSKHEGSLFPVENVERDEAVAFCNKLSISSKLKPCYSVKGETDPEKWGDDDIEIDCDFAATGYRLPTEEEWEYAARGGKNASKFKYAGSDTIDEVAWYSENSTETHEVGSKKANALSLYDMSGNVAEWCWNKDDSIAVRGGSGVKGGQKEVRRYDNWWGKYYTDYEYIDTKNSESQCIVYKTNLKNKSNAEDFIGFRYVCRLSDKELAKEREAEKQRVNKFLSQELSLIKVAGGTFKMGNPNEDAEKNQKPAHTVSVGGFYMTSTEITQKLYDFLMEENPSSTKGDHLPVENVTWGDAIVFCNKLSKLTGRTPCYSYEGKTDSKEWNVGSRGFSWSSVECNFAADGYRLPTEAEWEYAARGGKKQQKFTYSGSGNLGDVAWYEENADEKIHEVAQKRPNTLGLYDMSGNVIEWCWDIYNKDYYETSPEKNPKGAESGNNRVTRGGNIYSYQNGWYNTISSEERCRVWYRFNFSQSQGGRGLGFRVVRNEK